MSVPEPDRVVVRVDFTLREHPHEAIRLVEVSNTSLREDRGLKLPSVALPVAGLRRYVARP